VEFFPCEIDPYLAIKGQRIRIFEDKENLPHSVQALSEVRESYLPLEEIGAFVDMGCTLRRGDEFHLQMITDGGQVEDIHMFKLEEEFSERGLVILSDFVEIYQLVGKRAKTLGTISFIRLSEDAPVSFMTLPHGLKLGSLRHLLPVTEETDAIIQQNVNAVQIVSFSFDGAHPSRIDEGELQDQAVPNDDPNAFSETNAISVKVKYDENLINAFPVRRVLSQKESDLIEEGFKRREDLWTMAKLESGVKIWIDKSNPKYRAEVMQLLWEERDLFLRENVDLAQGCALFTIDAHCPRQCPRQ
jgi:hypothetical protein